MRNIITNDIIIKNDKKIIKRTPLPDLSPNTQEKGAKLQITRELEIYRRIKMQEYLSTGDIWLGSLILVETEAELTNIQINRNSCASINFTFSGKNLNALAQDYYAEKAQANVAQLREKLNFLKDIIFESKRN